MEELLKFESSKEFFDRFRKAVDEQDGVFIRESLEGVNPADITALLHQFNSEESKYVIDLLDREVGAEIINDLDHDIVSRFLKLFTPEEIAAYIHYLPSDDAADVLNQIPVKIREETIAHLDSDEKATHILDLLRYEEDVAGGLMAKELIKANENWMIRQCIDEIRRQKENVSKIYSVYVVDNQERLVGRVSIKKIILAKDDVKVKDICDREVVSVETSMHEEEVASIMRKYDLDAVPVINVKGKLVGRITIDDILDVVTEQAEEERQLMSGISEDVEEDDSIWMLTRARLPWLIIGMVGGLLAAEFIGIFEEDIILIPAMAFFIPLIMATGGNVGIQSSSIIVQSLAHKSMFGYNASKRLYKSLVVAIINGVVLAAMVFGANLIMGQGTRLALIVAIALFSVVVLASFLGTLTPLVLDKLGINPALASGPFITTANDLLGLGVYFLVAHLLYNL